MHKLMVYTIITLVLFQVAPVSKLTAQSDTAWATTYTCEWEMRLVDSMAVDYLPIQHQHSRAHPFSVFPLVIRMADPNDCQPCYNPSWTSFPPDRTWIMTCDWWVPYPRRWELTDHDIDKVVNATNFDGNRDGVPDWIQFDFNADGHCNLSDLSFFGEEYGQRWNLSDFSAMGSLYHTRR